MKYFQSLNYCSKETSFTIEMNTLKHPASLFSTLPLSTHTPALILQVQAVTSFVQR